MYKITFFTFHIYISKLSVDFTLCCKPLDTLRITYLDLKWTRPKQSVRPKLLCEHIFLHQGPCSLFTSLRVNWNNGFTCCLHPPPQLPRSPKGATESVTTNAVMFDRNVPDGVNRERIYPEYENGKFRICVYSFDTSMAPKHSISAAKGGGWGGQISLNTAKILCLENKNKYLHNKWHRFTRWTL